MTMQSTTLSKVSIIDSSKFFAYSTFGAYDRLAQGELFPSLPWVQFPMLPDFDRGDAFMYMQNQQKIGANQIL